MNLYQPRQSLKSNCPGAMDEVPTAGNCFFKKQMKLQLWLKLIPKLLILLLSFYVFVPQLVLASTYGSDAYGSCRYQEGCSASSDSSGMSPIPNKSLFNKYELIIFASFILISLLLLMILLLARRRKKSADEDDRPRTPPTRTQP
ncbi:hypothetical protein COU91_01300 [Candidatus Saccharibacteria bacterium CG10_big_fil_rev_8_21_14_0_10_47_8]|nr:MAG: hypothetical protein COU91_01300 [Candidatus Saccharibacteria bacterium CG10_big_fil_rev_8_21_14_0_10_47_8]